ncbi:hypothetical protein CCAX7_004240 [Capsulimonas corticalis]|uniref:Uncharacterized protein n=1 Tax=Capsulimonas corticalis TaxID=2219043 RepID=A0A402D2V3_9BACT|nr:hypothetical protein [Capsulimonas corticalis]BDI28373.1 hypothetical protein CCAX7_004240 [Capsulimonas corticalis]
MAEQDLESMYRTEVKPVAPVGGEVPAKFVKLLQSNKNDEEMRVYTVTFHPQEDSDEEDPDVPVRRSRSSNATMALVTVEFGEAKFQDWNKTDLSILEHEEEFQQIALRAVERAGED